LVNTAPADWFWPHGIHWQRRVFGPGNPAIDSAQPDGFFPDPG
jgi:hypothetical protein